MRLARLAELSIRGLVLGREVDGHDGVGPAAVGGASPEWLLVLDEGLDLSEKLG